MKEPEKIPIWVKLVKLPLEAWTVKGISSIASSLDKPLIMDKVTTQMCTEGIDRIVFARVLMEMNAKTDLKDRIELCYRNKNNETVGTKFVDVEYAWKLVRCSHCAVFGHEYSKCGFNPEKGGNNAIKPNSNFGGRMQGMKKRIESRPVRKEGQNNEAQKHDPITANHGKQTPNVPDNNEKIGKQTPYKEKEWSVPKDVIDAIRKSANKYSVLEDQDEEEILKGINLEEKGVVDRLKINGRDGTEVVEVMDNDTGMAKSVIANNLRSIDGGMGNNKKQKEIRRFICALIETHIKEPKLKRIYEFVYGNWSWESNMSMSSRGCRIIVAWDNQAMNMMLIHMCDQAMLYLVKNISMNTRFYCCFVYAANAGKDRKSLWKQLEVYKNMIKGNPWVLMRDLNVILNVSD
ncbi:RNA-directed DNA polymerase, eukaryota, reverse transcriptase zinc-binding domain protein, partial [Tanacetum coccineum]